VSLNKGDKLTLQEYWDGGLPGNLWSNRPWERRGILPGKVAVNVLDRSAIPDKILKDLDTGEFRLEWGLGDGRRLVVIAMPSTPCTFIGSFELSTRLPADFHRRLGFQDRDSSKPLRSDQPEYKLTLRLDSAAISKAKGGAL
jgi:hypothetical protein